MSLSKDEYNFCWEIENYLFCRYNPLSSPLITTKNIDRNKTDWYILFFQKGREREEYVTVHICCYSRDMGEKIIALNLMLYNADNEVIVVLDEEKGMLELEHCCFKFQTELKGKKLEEIIKKSSKDCLVVRCRVWLRNISDVNYASKTNKTVKTIMDFNKFSFEEEHYEIYNNLLKKIFTDMEDSQFEVTVKVPNDDVFIEIRNISLSPYGSLKVKCQIVLSDGLNTNALSNYDFFFFDFKTPQNNIWHFPPFFKKSCLEDYLLRDGSFILRFNFFISNGIETNIFDTENLDRNPSYKVSDYPVLMSLQENYCTMLLNEKYADLKLSIDGEMINAHKSIIASRSPVFSAMFDHDMVESQTGTINISDTSAGAMRLFLRFLYTGMLDDLDCETSLELLIVAEKYQVETLKEKCSQNLILHLDADNVCRVVSVAEMVGHAILKTAAINYIKKDAAKILGSLKWLELIEKNGKLGSEILSMFSNIIASAN